MLSKHLRFLMLSGLLIGVSACGRSPSTRSGPPRDTDAPAGAFMATNKVDIAQVLGDLTQLVRKYSVEQRQTPGSLEDLVAKGYLDSVPLAPDGRRFTITRELQVRLADR